MLGRAQSAREHPLAVRLKRLVEHVDRPVRADAGDELVALERQHFATDHNQLTAALMGEWGLPAVFIEPALHHEQPAGAPYESGSRGYAITYALALSNCLADICLAPEASRGYRLHELFETARASFQSETAMPIPP